MKNDLTRDEWIAVGLAFFRGLDNVPKDLMDHYVKGRKKVMKIAEQLLVESNNADEPIEGFESQSLKEQLQQKKKDSHQIWFERWYEKEHLEKKLLQSASKGFSKYAFIFQNDDDYTNRRLRDPLTIKLLKIKIHSINIRYEKSERKDFINRTYYTEKIIFDWSD